MYRGTEAHLSRVVGDLIHQFVVLSDLTRIVIKIVFLLDELFNISLSLQAKQVPVT